MRLSTRALCAAALAILVAACTRAAAQEPSASPMCLGTSIAPQYDQEVGGVFRDYIAGLVSSTAGRNVTTRAQYHLTAGQASDVALVSDEAVCSQAAVAFEKTIAADSGGVYDSTTVRPVYVVSTPDRYVVYSPQHTAGEFGVSLVFDTLWNRLAGFVF